MKVLEYGLGLLVAVALLLALLITSVEAVVYWNPGYFEKEYETYAVCDSVQMEMEDLLVVTDEMMAYLRGQRDTLQVETVVDGQKRGFFNAREIAHMEDVRGLFLGGLALRRGALLLGVCALGILALMKKLWVLPSAIIAAFCGILGLCAAGAILIATDFTRYFTVFHHIFFDNDLWILNPHTDLLIRIVPEPFFVDTAVRIALCFGGSLAVVLVFCLWLQKRGRRRREKPGKTTAGQIAV